MEILLGKLGYIYICSFNSQDDQKILFCLLRLDKCTLSSNNTVTISARCELAVIANQTRCTTAYRVYSALFLIQLIIIYFVFQFLEY